LSEFSFFFSYLFYLLITSIVVNLADVLGLQFYVTAFWLRFLTLVIAEFALLLEIGDHIFRPYPAIRKLGRLITLGITFLFSIAYILPPLIEARPTSIAILDLVKRSALTKGVIIVALLGMARFYRVRLGRNVAGLVLGFAAYMAINTANFALAESYGRELYGPIFSTVGPLSQTLCVLIWTVALWHLEPVLAPVQGVAAHVARNPEPLPDRVGRLNATLSKLFRR
jgi:hypothetical protein